MCSTWIDYFVDTCVTHVHVGQMFIICIIHVDAVTSECCVHISTVVVTIAYSIQGKSTSCISIGDDENDRAPH